MALKICEEHVDHFTEQPNINQEAPNQKDELECDACEFKCKSEITLRKHSNTKHPIEITHIDRDTSNNLKCVMCEDKFETQNEFNIHLGEHFEEIQDFEVKDILNGQETIPLKQIWLNMSTKTCQLMLKRLRIKV